MRGAPAHARWGARSRDAKETAAIGATFGRTAPDGTVILLEGPLGAGKTTFAQGVGEGCGVREPVTSPTYNLVLHYRGERPFTHVDLFRLADARELATLDLEDVLGGPGVTCVEWPAILEEAVEPPWARVRIWPERVPAGSRRIAGELAGTGWESTRAVLAALGAGPG